MIVELSLDKEKLAEYNERIRKFRKEHPEYKEYYKEISKLEDFFMPYLQFLEILKKENYLIIDDDSKIDCNGVYVCGLNSKNIIGDLTNYIKVKNFNSPIYWDSYGVCDNASQVLEYYNELYEANKDYMKDKNFIILLSPIFKEDQPETGGWRWYKWGEYIGKYKSEYEYLYDEKEIDYVLCFQIIEVEED